MRISSIAFNQDATALVPEAMIRSQVIAATAAVVLVCQASFPTSQVLNPGIYWTEQVKPAIDQQFGYINESLVFDVRFAQNLARSLWLTRYNSAFPVSAMLVESGECEHQFLKSWTRAADTISPAVMAFMDLHWPCIVRLKPGMTQLVEATKG